MKMHQRNKVEENVKRCQFCTYSTANLSHLHDHVMAVHFEAPPEFACDICEYKTSRGFAVLNQHKERKHSKITSRKGIKNVKTPVVIGLKRESSSRTAVKKEVRVPWVKLPKDEVLDDVKYYVCDQCGYKCTSRSALKGHKKSAICGHRVAAFKHASRKMENSDQEVQCSKCKSNFSKDYIEYHKTICGLDPGRVKEETAVLREEAIDKSLKQNCGTCHFATYSEEELNDHTRRMHAKVTAYECNQCEFKSTLRFKLNRHQWKAHGNDLATASFNLWAKQHRKKVVRENPNKTFQDINRQLRAHWKALPVVELEKFIEEAKMSSQERRNKSLRNESVDHADLSQMDHNETADEKDAEWKTDKVVSEGKERCQDISNVEDGRSKKRSYGDGPRSARRKNEGKFVCDTVGCGYRTKFVGNLKTHCNRLSHSASLIKPSKIKDEEEESEETYCVCKRVQGNDAMIACDNKTCSIEWYHFTCVGLSSVPKGKWYCPDCSGSSDLTMRNMVQFKEETKEGLISDGSVGPLDQEDMETDQTPKLPPEDIKSRTVPIQAMMSNRSRRDPSQKSDLEIRAQTDEKEVKKCGSRAAQTEMKIMKSCMTQTEIEGEFSERTDNETILPRASAATTERPKKFKFFKSKQPVPENPPQPTIREEGTEGKESCSSCREVNDRNLRLILDLAAAEERVEAERRLRHEIERKLASARITQLKKEPVDPPENPNSILGI